MTCRKIRSSRRSVVMHSRSMTSKRSSERSSNGHWNSKKRRGSTGLVLKNCEENVVREPRNVTSGETLPRLPLVEKRDYIQNWILTSDARFSQRPFSSSLGAEAKGEKRFASSPTRDCTGKRARVRVETKENSGSRLDGDEKISECRKKLRAQPEVSIPPCSKSVASCSKPEVSETSENRVICKFSWHGKKSRRRLEGSSRSVLTSDTGNEANEDFIMDTGSSGSFDKRSRKIEPASPLRWTGYEIGDCSRLLPASQTLSSPIMEADVIIHSSSSSDSLDAVILDDQSSVKSKRSPTGSVRRGHQELEPRTPCRWKGYGSPEDSKFPEVPLLSSTPSEDASEPEIERLEDEGKIEIESVATTVSGVIETVATQNHEPIERIYSSQRVEERSPVTETFDSDETHYSDGKLAQISVAEVTVMEKQLNANDRTMARNRSELISEASSSLKNEETGLHVSAGRTPRDFAKKRKRAKKGSLVAKLQSLVSLRVSSLQIWQYRFSRNEIQNSRHQCVKLVIRERETRYGRHFLLANVLEDPHKLLDDLFCDDDQKTSREGTVTLIIVPEVNGTPRMGLNSVVDVYPPWEIMDRDARLICALYFDVVATQSESTNQRADLKEDNVVAAERVLEEFNCPCFQRGAIDSSCTVKFTNARPSFVSEIFGSSNRPRSNA